jgi:hypothetical protein
MKTTVEDLKKKDQQKEKTLNDMQGELAHLKKTYQTQLYIRANVLESMVRSPGGKNREIKNGIVHGAALLTDLDVIHNYQASQHKDLAVLCDGFEYIYGLSIIKYQEQLKTAPEEIVKTLNWRGDMKILHIWNKKGTRRRQMAKKSLMESYDTIVNLWLQSYEMSTPFPNDTVHEALDRLNDDWWQADGL